MTQTYQLDGQSYTTRAERDQIESGIFRREAAKFKYRDVVVVTPRGYFQPERHGAEIIGIMESQAPGSSHLFAIRTGRNYSDDHVGCWHEDVVRLATAGEVAAFLTTVKNQPPDGSMEMLANGVHLMETLAHCQAQADDEHSGPF